MHLLGHRRQRGKLRASHTRGLVATGTCLVGTLVIVMDQKGFGGLLDLLPGTRPMHLQALLRERAMKSLHIRVQVGPMWRGHNGVYPHTEQKDDQRRRKNAPGRASDAEGVIIEGEHVGPAMFPHKL